MRRTRTALPQRGFLLSLLAWLALPGLFLALHPLIGDPVAVLFLLPVVVSAWLYGARVGVWSAAGSVACVSVLFALHGRAVPTAEMLRDVLTRAPLSLLVAVLAGWAVGSLRDLRAQLLRQREQLLAQREQLLRQQRELEHQVRHDALTGLPNRRAFDADLDAAYASLAWAAGEVTVVMLDLDGLKRVNDTQGHECGDALLRAFAGALRDALVPGGRVYRLGGDEYAALLCGPGAAEGALLARARGAVTATRAQGFDGMDASAGLARSSDGLTRAELLRRADERMYHQKRRRQGDALPANESVPAPMA